MNNKCNIRLFLIRKVGPVCMNINQFYKLQYVLIYLCFVFNRRENLGLDIVSR